MNNENESPTKSRKTSRWVIGTAGVALLVGSFFLGQATKPVEIQEVEVEKEVIVQKFTNTLPQVCHETLLTFESYGKNLANTVAHYENLVKIIEGELNGKPSPITEYETLGLSIGITKSLAEEDGKLLDDLIDRCNATM